LSPWALGNKCRERKLLLEHRPKKTERSALQKIPKLVCAVQMDRFERVGLHRPKKTNGLVVAVEAI
jgi:hypothetical protein